MSTGTDWNSKRITIIGAGVSGTALALLARRLGAEVFVSEERNTILPEVAEALGKEDIAWEVSAHSSRAFDADVLLLSSGIPPNAPCLEEAKRLGLPVVGELDFAVPHIRGRIVGVTGCNGKSTLTALTGHILQKTGFKTAVGGNIGSAASLFTEEAFDFVVLELSSFQLHWAHELRCEVAIVTNLAPDHIDWHGSYEAYVAAKAKILSLQDAKGWGIVQDRDCDALGLQKFDRTVVLSWEEAPVHKTAGHVFMGEDAAVLRMGERVHPLFRYGDVNLLGKHNMENVAMGLTAAYLLDVAVTDVGEFLSDFHPLPHRCELVGTVNGVMYVDDSKGTNVAASVTALTSIAGRKVVILGGKGKGEDYAPLAEAVAREADAAVVLGAEKANMQKALKDAGYSAVCEVADMPEAVRTAHRLARPGMVVLLSPACTSWDMYPNYGKRGEHFRSLVRQLRLES
ncbi:MAG: UDP-N-acetylmuramoyl-L-alanine--D-glutamate ligase [Synergistaceae bacterium]|jgi:UDP-N-acetylmuramoylalanine--D-glutamate ligase|nr:UDP-N-acetylmuramoyl-L-alanine--D-glutamate ligase [Synergistaceae bacterium]